MLRFNDLKSITALLIATACLFLSDCGGEKEKTPSQKVLQCGQCGMKCEGSQTLFVLKLTDGTEKPACSLNCVSLLRANLKAKVTSILTADFLSGKMVDAKRAHFLKGSDVTPKVSMPPFFLAFSSRGDAVAFQREHGGQILSFDEALKSLSE